MNIKTTIAFKILDLENKLWVEIESDSSDFVEMRTIESGQEYIRVCLHKEMAREVGAALIKAAE